MNEARDRYRVLVVDDEDGFREGTRRVLDRRGFEVQTACTGEEAISLVDARAPDVVLLDLRMRGMGGMEALRRMRRDHPRLPVIILTGHGRLDDAVEGIGLDIVDFIQKPVDMDVLAERIRTVVARGQATGLRERTISELMIPVESYIRLYEDQTLAEAVDALRRSLSLDVLGHMEEKGHRSILVFDREERFAGILRVHDVLGAVLPGFLADSVYASFFTGMFLAQSKLVGRQRVGDLATGTLGVDIDAPLMEALHVMWAERLVNLPVTRDGEIVGVLRDKDLVIELSRQMS